MPQWDTSTRGQNRVNGSSYFDQTGLDGYSDMDDSSLPGRGTLRDVEDLTMLHGLGLKEMGDNSESGRNDNQE